MNFKSDYNFGDAVYLVNDPMQDLYLITGIYIAPDGYSIYISHCGREFKVYAFEISREKTIF